MADQYKVRLTSRTLRDLDGIYEYISKTLLEPETAINLVEEIEREILSLEFFPNRCPLRRTGAYADKGYRQLLEISRILPGHHELTVPVDMVDRIEKAFRELSQEGKLRQGGGLFQYGDFQIRI